MVQVTRKIAYWVHEKYSFIKIFLIFLILLCPLLLKMVIILFSRKYVAKKHKKNLTVGFFHPNCNACTPQEKVLWSAVKAVQIMYDNVQICIYTGDLDAKSKTILDNAKSKFDIKLQPNIRFIYLHRRKWIKSFTYLGSIWVACEALSLLKPHVMIDTVGYGFVNPVFKYVGGCKVISYIHNPLVSIDKLKTRHVILDNTKYMITRRSAGVLGISKGIAFLYGLTGRAADIIIVNSSWTEDNINSIWKCPKRTALIYPPVGLEKLMVRAISSSNKRNNYQIINASEFKSENNHGLILQALNKARFKIKQNIMNEASLLLINLSTDCNEAYTQNLKDLVKLLNLEDYVKIYSQYVHSDRLEKELIKSSYGIYANIDDHFGSDIIAGLAAGQIMIVHDSGASKSELIDTTDESRNGYLAKSVEEYAHAIFEALSLSAVEKQRIQDSARKTAQQFSQLYFQKEFLRITEPCFVDRNKSKRF